MRRAIEVDIHVPCRAFRVCVSVAPWDGLSPIEETLIASIHAGLSSVEALAVGLALPYRIVLDALVDLVNGGLVYRPNGKLAVRSFVGDAMASVDWARTFSVARPEKRIHRLMQEGLSGCLLSTQFATFAGADSQARAPWSNDVPSIRSLTAEVLGPAVLDLPGEHKSRLASVELVWERSGGVPWVDWELALLPVTVRVQQRRFEVLGPITVPEVVRETMSKALRELWEQGYGRGPGQFFSQLGLPATSPASSSP